MIRLSILTLGLWAGAALSDSQAQAPSYEQQIQPQYKIDLQKQLEAEQKLSKQQPLPNVAICQNTQNQLSKEEQLRKEIAWCEQRLAAIQQVYQNQLSDGQSSEAAIAKTRKALEEMGSQKASKEQALDKLKTK